MIVSELIPFLQSIDARPKKRLSQNFLIDPNIVRKIVQTAEIQPGDAVLEIGPGPGALTAALLDAGAHVFAIEKDPVFAHALPRLQTTDQRLTIFCDDALEFPLDRLPAKKVVANLPYHITTPILERLFAHSFSTLTLMVQKELAIRLLAQSGTKDFSSLTLFAQFYATMQTSFPVGSGCFYPKPKVDSTVIRLDIQKPQISEAEPFFKLVRRAFQQRRKMLSTSLQEMHSSQKIRGALTALGLRSDARPESLSLDQWLLFFNEISG